MTIIRHISVIMGLFFGSLAVFLWGLSAQEIIGFDSRFYLFALEMGRHGLSWFPTTYHQPYPDYPATGTLAVYGLAMLFGGINKLIAVLPTAIMATITLCLVYAIGALQSKRWGFAAVCFMLLTVTFLKSARAISLDMATTMVTTACFYCLCLADLKQKKRFALWIYPCLLLGFAFRGPIGLIVPTAVVCTYYLLELNIKKCLVAGSLAFCLLVGAMFVLMLVAYQAGGLAFVQEMLRMQIWGRIDNAHLPFYFYFTSSFIDYAPSYPLAMLVMLIAGAGALFQRRQAVRIPSLLFLCGWMGIILLGLSIPGDKKARYILPMLPAAALIAAYPFSATQTPLFVSLRVWLLRVFLLLPLILEIALLGLYVKQPPMDIAVPYTSALLALALVQFFIFIIMNRLQGTKREFFILSAATGSFLFAYFSVAEPIELYLDRAHALVARIETVRLEQHAKLAFYKEHPDGLPIKYLVNMTHDERPQFLHAPEELLAFQGSVYFVGSANYFDELPPSIAEQFNVVARDNLGHTPVVVFTRKLA